MNRAIAIVGALGAVWLLMLAALGSYMAFASHGMFGDMWDMMSDMADMRGMMGGGGAGPQTSGSASGTGQITVSDFRFEPTLLTVTLGTIVSWTNEDSAPHTATARDGSFDTGRLNQGDSSKQQRFDTPGTFAYYCEVHPSMTGEVIVTNR